MAQQTPLRDPQQDHLLTPQNSALVIIDYQPEQVGSVGSMPHDELMLNVETVIRAAVSFEVPVVLTTVGVQLGANGPTDERLSSMLPGAEEIDRTSLNSWEDPDFRDAVKATGRHKLIMCALWTEVCLAFPTLDAIGEGYEIYPVADAVGGVTPRAHEAAMQRVIQAGAHPISALGLVCELQRDWARGNGEKLRTIMRWYFSQMAHRD